MQCTYFIDNTTGERIGLNPIYDIDFLGNSSIFYNNTIQINNDFESNNSIYVLESTQTDENINYFCTRIPINIRLQILST